MSQGGGSDPLEQKKAQIGASKTFAGKSFWHEKRELPFENSPFFGYLKPLLRSTGLAVSTITRIQVHHFVGLVANRVHIHIVQAILSSFNGVLTITINT